METIALKNRIRDFLERADERVLSIVNGVFENYYKNEIVDESKKEVSMKHLEEEFKNYEKRYPKE